MEASICHKAKGKKSAMSNQKNRKISATAGPIYFIFGTIAVRGSLVRMLMVPTQKVDFLRNRWTDLDETLTDCWGEGCAPRSAVRAPRTAVCAPRSPKIADLPLKINCIQLLQYFLLFLNCCL